MHQVRENTDEVSGISGPQDGSVVKVLTARMAAGAHSQEATDKGLILPSCPLTSTQR